MALGRQGRQPPIEYVSASARRWEEAPRPPPRKLPSKAATEASCQAGGKLSVVSGTWSKDSRLGCDPEHPHTQARPGELAGGSPSCCPKPPSG